MDVSYYSHSNNAFYGMKLKVGNFSQKNNSFNFRMRMLLSFTASIPKTLRNLPWTLGKRGPLLLLQSELKILQKQKI